MRALINACKIIYNCIHFYSCPRLTKCVHRDGFNFSEVLLKCFCKHSFHSSYLLNKASVEIGKHSKTENETGDKPTKKKKEKLTYITLVEGNDDVTVVTLEDATKLALRRNLKLIKVKESDTKSERPTYQLMTTAQYLAEEKKSKSKTSKSNSSIKGIKLLSISSRIDSHDLNAKVNNIIKWLNKYYEVRVVISNDNGEGVSTAGYLGMSLISLIIS